MKLHNNKSSKQRVRMVFSMREWILLPYKLQIAKDNSCLVKTSVRNKIGYVASLYGGANR